MTDTGLLKVIYIRYKCRKISLVLASRKIPFYPYSRDVYPPGLEPLDCVLLYILLLLFLTLCYKRKSEQHWKRSTGNSRQYNVHEGTCYSWCRRSRGQLDAERCDRMAQLWRLLKSAVRAVKSEVLRPSAYSNDVKDDRRDFHALSVQYNYAVIDKIQFN